MKVKPIQKAGGVVVELERTEKQLPLPATSVTDANLPEFQLKKILVPVDFSKCSLKAMQYAIPFAKQFGASLVLFHVVEPVVPASEMMPVETESVESAQRELEELQKQAGGMVPTAAVVRQGCAHLEIIDAAKELGIGLIVLSTHGRTGLEHIILGSIAEKVIRHATCPVLIVREHEREFIEEQKTD